MKQRYFAVIAIAVPLILTAALIAVSVLYTTQKEENDAEIEALSTAVAGSYRQATYALSSNVNDMQTALKKLSVTFSRPQQVLLLSDVWRLSGAATANLANLPVSHADTADTTAFLIRAGDYARALSRQLLDGGTITPDDGAQIDSLYEASVRVGDRIARDISDDAFLTEQIDTEGYFTASEAGVGESGESIANYPTLIYDGPFSQSNANPEPRGLTGTDIDDRTALEKATEFLGGGELQYSGLENGTIPVYGFFGTDADGRSVEITVTKRGGAILYMMADVPAGQNGRPDEETTERMKESAQAYLSEHGYEDMEPTYAQYYDGVGVFNFASTQDGVILYNDLVKVYVERASGRVSGFDATNYLMMHTARTLDTPAIDEMTARAAVSDALDIRSVRLALIPMTPSSEKLCYEFKGVCRGTDFIVYIDAMTGTEREIFEIIDSEDGELVV